MMSCKTKIIF